MALLICGVIGCGNADPTVSATGRRLHALAIVYGDFVAAKRRSPQNKEELAAHVKYMPDFATAENRADEAPGDIFTSERDDEPFIVRYGIDVQNFSQAASSWIAREKLGEGGRRLVVKLNGQVELLDEATCRQRGILE